MGQLRQRKRRSSILSVDSRSTFRDLSAVKMISFTICFILLGNTHGFPQLESFDRFFEKFGSTQFTRPTASNPPSNSQPLPPQTPQFQPSARPSNDVGKVFPTAVPYVHDPRGDGSFARSQQRPSQGTQNEKPPGNTKQHQEALQRNALHRQQLAEVIASHNKVLEQREQEIIRASSEEEQDDIGETRIFQKPTHKSSKKSKGKQTRFNFERFLRTEDLKHKEEKEDANSLTDIEKDVVENLNLIGQLAEEIALLDVQAYDIFSRQKSSALRKRPNRKGNSREIKEEEDEEEYFNLEEDEEEDVEHDQSNKILSNGRIRNIGLRIRQ